MHSHVPLVMCRNVSACLFSRGRLWLVRATKKGVATQSIIECCGGIRPVGGQDFPGLGSYFSVGRRRGDTAAMGRLFDRKEVTSPNFYRAIVGEFFAMLLFVFIGIGSTTGWPNAPTSPSMVQIALAFGIAIATMVQCFGHISGGHVNPAVTIALLLTGKVTILRAVLYIIAQLVGAIAGAGLVYAVTPEAVRGGLGVTGLSTGMSAGMGVGVELLLTFQLVLTIFATVDGNRTDLNGSASLSIGLSVVIGHLFGVKYTGASMNPARSFGPVVIMNAWDNHWVYWVGPIAGAILAAWLYEFLLDPTASTARLRRCVTCASAEDQPIHDAELTDIRKLDNEGL